MSHQAGLFITVEKACIEGHLVSFSGKGIVIFPVVLLDIIKTKQNNSVGLWESRVSLERAGHKDPSSEWSCFHSFHSLLLFKVQRSPSEPERIPFLSLSDRSDPRDIEREGDPSIFSVAMSQETLSSVWSHQNSSFPWSL